MATATSRRERLEWYPHTTLTSAIRRLVSRLVARDVVWRPLARTLVPFVHFAETARRQHERATRAHLTDAAIQAIVSDRIVKHGPFKGLQYPQALSNDGTLFSKLLGSYERELHPLVERLAAHAYTDVIDVGCAEGYYAVGLARRIPCARVHAYDIDEHSLSLCRQMAALNGVGDRVATGNHVDAATLQALDIRGRALIVCDCEGYERVLLTPALAAQFAKHDFVIEVHDFIDRSLSAEIRSRFSSTHDIEVIRSVDDREKARTYRYDELKAYDQDARRLLLGEARPETMEWFVLTPKRQ